MGEVGNLDGSVRTCRDGSLRTGSKSEVDQLCWHSSAVVLKEQLHGMSGIVLLGI